jgi:hypothetical protein
LGGGGNNNQGSEEEQDEDAEVVVESTNVIFIVDAVDSLTAHDSDIPTNLKSLSRMPIRRIPSSKSLQEKGVNKDDKTDSHSTSQFLEMIKLDMQDSNRCQEEDMEFYCIQAK